MEGNDVYIIMWLIGGIVAGWLAGLLVRGRGFGIIGDLIFGIIGGLIGGFLGGLVGIVATNWIGNVLIAALGAVILVVVIRSLRRV
jgi:uncharacterized membrane protein YeaQ/YmgE (transglycosylase-associated protein family)